MSLFLNTLVIFVVNQHILQDIMMKKPDNLANFSGSPAHVEEGCIKLFFVMLFCPSSLGFLQFFRDIVSEALEEKSFLVVHSGRYVTPPSPELIGGLNTTLRTNVSGHFASKLRTVEIPVLLLATA
jgi:hypothetical protein